MGCPVGPFKNFPQITVYHPQQGNGHVFANIGWTGWIGSITGQFKPHINTQERRRRKRILLTRCHCDVHSLGRHHFEGRGPVEMRLRNRQLLLASNNNYLHF